MLQYLKVLGSRLTRQLETLSQRGNRVFLYPASRYPKGHPLLAEGINNLAFLYQQLGDYAKAQPLFERALQMYERLFPKSQYPIGHPNVVAWLTWRQT